MPAEEYINLFLILIAALGIPLAWAVVLYPLLRKLKQAWPVLLIVAALLSLALLGARSIIGIPVPLTIFIPGLLAGILILFLFFKSKLNWLNTQPANDTFFRQHNIKAKIRLRHLFQVAISVEEAGQRFYNILAHLSTETNVRKLYNKMAQDEIEHKKLMEQTLFRWLPIPIDQHTLALLEQELTQNGIFLKPPPPEATEAEAVQYAIDQENKTADFYLSFEQTFPEAWKKMHLQQLVDEEKIHAHDLMKFYP